MEDGDTVTAYSIAAVVEPDILELLGKERLRL